MARPLFVIKETTRVTVASNRGRHAPPTVESLERVNFDNGLGDKEQAFRHLEAMFAERTPSGGISFKVNPTFDSLRAGHRYSVAALISRRNPRDKLPPLNDPARIRGRSFNR